MPVDVLPDLDSRQVPTFDPPFDDEMTSELWAPSEQNSLGWTGHRELAATGALPMPRPSPATVSFVAPRLEAASLAGASGEAKLAVRRFVSMCVEVLNGYRPAAHLRRLAHPMCAMGIVAQAVAASRRASQLRRGPRTTPGRGNPDGGDPSRGTPDRRAPDRRQHRAGPVGVIRLRLCEPRPGAVEATVLLVTGDRTWALALRLELHHDAWTATVLRLI